VKVDSAVVAEAAMAAVVVVVADLQETEISERLPASAAEEDTAATVTAAAEATVPAVATAALLPIMEAEPRKDTVDLKAPEEVVLPPVVGGRSSYRTEDPSSFGNLGLPFRSVAVFVILIARLVFAMSSICFNLVIGICQYLFRLFFFYNGVFYNNHGLPQSNIHRKLDFCTVKISVEHGMGGFRRFLQRVFYLGLLIGKGGKQSFSWRSRSISSLFFSFLKWEKG
jgi:hypothetical protein